MKASSHFLHIYTVMNPRKSFVTNNDSDIWPIEIDWLIDKQIDGRMDGRTDRQTDRYHDLPAIEAHQRQTYLKLHVHLDCSWFQGQWSAYHYLSWQTRQTDRPTNRQTDRQTDIHHDLPTIEAHQRQTYLKLHAHLDHSWPQGQRSADHYLSWQTDR